jgi:hypothetical protein
LLRFARVLVDKTKRMGAGLCGWRYGEISEGSVASVVAIGLAVRAVLI